jgi:outer membrane protein OmpA-like peptidoglycan-associated protein/ABC-type nitrate/sulfonate/bicarbonate transport system substrate-binding protein
MAVKLKPGAKIILTLLVAGGVGWIVNRYYGIPGLGRGSAAGASASASAEAPPAAASAANPVPTSGVKSKYKVALSQWPGHMPLVIGNGGLTTQPDSAAAQEGISIEVVFIEDPEHKNTALEKGEVDFVWQTVDEMPINMGGYKKAGVDARAFLQIDWSRGGDACVASADVKKVEDVLGRKSAMMLFSPDHTVFEFMINNSRLTPAQIRQVRDDTSFSPDDFTYGRKLFVENKVDVACLWEPDVSLALKARPGAHRLFSTADATELVADVLLTRQDLLARQPEVAAKVARVWFAGVAKAESDRMAAARFVSKNVPRFRDELGYEGTLRAFEWVKWTSAGDNAGFFGLDGQTPAFDRAYNQADGIWIQYPKAEITDRFAAASLRNDAIVRKIWESGGKKAGGEQPKYEPKIAETGSPVFTKPITINFKTGDSSVDSESMHILNTQVVPQLEMARAMYVRVEGNTDDVGDKKQNQGLSEKRAKSVVDYLVTKGINPGRISAKGNGDANPLASNKTNDGRAANRRTDVLFISGAGR